MADVQHKRGTRSDLNTLAAANGLLVGQVYFITDEGRLSIATSVSAYQAAAKEGEGGSPELYAENPSSPTAPSATGTNAVAIGSGADATADQAIALGLNAQSTAAKAVSIFGDAGSTSSTAIGQNSTGLQAKTRTGAGAMALGGSYASGTDSFAAAIANNTSSYGAIGNNSVAMGEISKSTGTDSISIGNANVSSGNKSVALGNNNSVTTGASFSLGAYNTNSADFTLTLGQDNVTAHKFSAGIGFGGVTRAWGHHATGFGYGINAGTFGLGQSTTDATAKDLVGGNAATVAGGNNQVILKASSLAGFTGVISARSTTSGSTECAAWEVKGLIRRGTTASDTVLINTAITILSNVPGWAIALTADTTNGALKISVTGAAATNVKWVAKIETVEV